MADKKTVSVICDAPSGIVLRRYKIDPPTFGEPVAKPIGDPVTLHNGVNEVDEEFWKAWADQNKDSMGPVRLRETDG